MPSPLQFPPKLLAALGLALCLAGCQIGSTPRAVPSVAQLGADLNCSKSDHAFEDPQAGWGFCYPASWKYLERSQSIVSPPGLDLTFDITYAPPTPVACANPAPAGSPQPPCSGDFANMIISTYERGGSPDLTSWLRTNMSQAPTGDSIRWGNAIEAQKLGDGRRIALTAHHVVIMDLHPGLLDLETEMSSRLGTWKFSF
jgi:hypothetical protein